MMSSLGERTGGVSPEENDKSGWVFDDTETASQHLSAFWDVELLQANRGRFRLDLHLASVGRCMVYDARTEVGLVASGRRPDRFVTISPITADCSASRYRGRTLEPEQLLIMDPGGDVFQQLARGHRQAAVSIPVDLFRRVAMAEFASGDRVDDLIAWQTLRTDRRKFNRFCRKIFAILRADDSILARADGDVLLTEHVVGLLVNGEKQQGDLPSAWNRRQIVRQALDLIHARLRQPPTILELCEATGASRRTLFYAFNDLLDLSPNAYAKRVRLQAARHLISANLDHRCVQRVARELGFTHEGQFAMDYASAFGESPSKTRKRLLA